MKKNSQIIFQGLIDITLLLNQLSIFFWLDSGTLLGIFRSGDILAGDDDIDIGIWETGIQSFLANKQKFRKNGYSIHYQKYKGIIYSLTLKKKNKNNLPIHVHVYFLKQNFAWSPQVVACQPKPIEQPEWAESNNPIREFILWCKRESKHSLSNTGNIYRRLFGLVFCLPIWGFFYISKEYIDRKYWEEIWPFKLIYKIYTWKIPAHYFKKVNYFKFNSYEVPIPMNTAEYLSYRYGNWKVEKQDWYYWKDDGAVFPQRPEVVLSDLN